METTVTAMEAVTTAMVDVFELSGAVLTQITTQPILLTIFAASLIPIGIATFVRLKRAAR